MMIRMGTALVVIIIVIVALVVIIGIYLLATYNGLVRSNVRVDEAWSDITVQLKRRADLIPNLIEAVKGFSRIEPLAAPAHFQATLRPYQQQGLGWLQRHAL